MMIVRFQEALLRPRHKNRDRAVADGVAGSKALGSRHRHGRPLQKRKQRVQVDAAATPRRGLNDVDGAKVIEETDFGGRETGEVVAPRHWGCWDD